MKIRAGFVSNSSTSTFIIRADGLVQTVFDLAEIMMPERGGGPYYQEDQRRLEQMRADKMDPNTPLAFQSCNYGTYILPLEVDGKLVFAVSTCNNVPWYDCDINKLYSGSSAGKAVFKMFGLPWGEWDALHSAIKKERDFVWVASGVEGHPPDKYPRDQWCPKHPYTTPWQSGMKLVCRDCGGPATSKRKSS